MEQKTVAPGVDESDLVSKWENYFSGITSQAKELVRQIELRQVGAVEIKALRAVLKSKLTPRELELLSELNNIISG